MSLREDGNRNREMVSDVGGHQEIKSDQMANGYAEDRSHGVDSKVRRTMLHLFMKNLYAMILLVTLCNYRHISHTSLFFLT